MEAAECVEKSQELGRLCGNIEERWTHVRQKLAAEEDSVFVRYSDSLQKWFGVGQSDLVSEAADGLRGKVRDRVEKLVLQPLLEQLRVHLRSGLVNDEQVSQVLTSPGSHAVNALLEHWKSVVEPSVAEAKLSDARLVRKTQRLAKTGAVQQANVEEAAGRPKIWRPIQASLDDVLPSARALWSLLDAATSTARAASMEKLTVPIPTIVCRAVCDWYFQRSSAELQQLENWWQGASAALQRRPVLWQRLRDSEGLLLKRIENGIEELQGLRWRYVTLATFGAAPGQRGSKQQGPTDEWPDRAMGQLAEAVCHMRHHLRSIRDSAAWRVIDVAKSLQKQLLVDSDGQKKSLWERLAAKESVAALCEVLEVRPPHSSEVDWASGLQEEALEMVQSCVAALPSSQAEDFILQCLRRVGKLMDVAAELLDLTGAAAGAKSGDGAALPTFIQGIVDRLSALQEDLLVVLDEPDSEALGGWLKRVAVWSQETVRSDIDAAMVALTMHEASSGRAVQEARLQRLKLAKACQLLTSKPVLAAWLFVGGPLQPLGEASPPADVAAGVRAAGAQEAGLAVLDIEEPPLAPTDRAIGEHRRAVPATDADAAGREAAEAAGSPRAGVAVAADGASDERGCVAAEDVMTRKQAPKPPAVANDGGGAPPCPCAAREEVVADVALVEACLAKEPRNPSRSSQVSTPSTGITACPTPASMMSRPVTPSWLEPPWPRAAMLPAQEACEDPDGEAVLLSRDRLSTPLLPKWRLVAGEVVPKRQSASMRLPALVPPDGAKAAQPPRPAW
eukprot:TRINITY_DN49366_c0_g1_i1.p1 TRINITY_DN49366_c0_g1~~TRINITY_DN49366_c0_g1_i1.p1  ORF type:complete len:790 (-),score=211.72 TRINITY_DN49366_c0_g1_i1:225-2594(-)